jgi:hypothetical protein
MVGASIAVGYVLGSVVPSTTSRERASAEPDLHPEPPAPRGAFAFATTHAAKRPERSKGPSFLSRLAEKLQPEIEQLKGLAIGVTAAIVRDLIKDRLPESLTPHVQEMLHGATQRLGGTEIEGPILSEERSGVARHADY